jgi:hypothetical protein
VKRYRRERDMKKGDWAILLLQKAHQEEYAAHSALKAFKGAPRQVISPPSPFLAPPPPCGQ